MTHYAIFPRDTAGAMLQHITQASDEDAAFEDFTDIVGAHADRHAFAIIEITPDQRAEIEEWHDNGAPADEAPEWLDEAIHRASA